MKAKKTGCSISFKFKDFIETDIEAIEYFRTFGELFGANNKTNAFRQFIDAVKNGDSILSFIDDKSNVDKVLWRMYKFAQTKHDVNLYKDDIDTDNVKYLSVNYFETRISSDTVRYKIVNDIHNEIASIFYESNIDINNPEYSIDTVLNERIRQNKLDLINRILANINIDNVYDSIDAFVESDDFIRLRKIWAYDYAKAAEEENPVDLFNEAITYNQNVSKDTVQSDIAKLFCYDSIIKSKLNASFINTKKSSLINTSYSLKGKCVFKNNYFESSPHQYMDEVNDMFNFFLEGIPYSPLYLNNYRGTINKNMLGPKNYLTTQSLSTAMVDLLKVIEDPILGEVKYKTKYGIITLREFYNRSTTGSITDMKYFLRCISVPKNLISCDSMYDDVFVLHHLSHADSAGILMSLVSQFEYNGGQDVRFGYYTLYGEICRLLRETTYLPMLQKNLDRPYDTRGIIEKMKNVGYSGMYKLRDTLTSNLGRMKSISDLGLNANVTYGTDQYNRNVTYVKIDGTTNGTNWKVICDMEQGASQFSTTIFIIENGERKIVDELSIYNNNRYTPFAESNKEVINDIESTLNKISAYALGKSEDSFGTLINGNYTEFQRAIGYNNLLDMKVHTLILVGLGVWFQCNEKMQFSNRPKKISYGIKKAFGDGFKINRNPNNSMKVKALPDPFTNQRTMLLAKYAQDIYEGERYYNRGVTSTVVALSGKKLDEQHIHCVATSAKRVWDNYRKNQNSPSRYNFLFREVGESNVPVFLGMRKYSEIQLNGNTVDVRKLSKSDMFMLFYINGLLDNPLTQFDGVKTGYFMPITYSDKNFIDAVEYNEDQLIERTSRVIASGLMDDCISFLEGGNVDIDDLIERYKNIDSEHITDVSYDKDLDSITKAFKAIRFLDNALYYKLQDEQVQKDFDRIKAYSGDNIEFRCNPKYQKTVTEYARQYNNDRLLKRKYRELYESNQFDRLESLCKGFGILDNVFEGNAFMSPDEYDFNVYKFGSFSDEINIISGLHFSKTCLREKLLMMHKVGSSLYDLYTQKYEMYTEAIRGGDKDVIISADNELHSFIKSNNIDFMYDNYIGQFMPPSDLSFDYNEYDHNNQLVSIHNILKFGISLNMLNLRGRDVFDQEKSSSSVEYINRTWDLFQGTGWTLGDDVVLFRIQRDDADEVKYTNITNYNQLTYLKITDSEVLESLENGTTTIDDYDEIVEGDKISIRYKSQGKDIKVTKVTYGKNWNESEFLEYNRIFRKTHYKLDHNGNFTMILNPVLEMLRNKQSMLVDLWRNAISGQSFQFDKSESGASLPLIHINNPGIYNIMLNLEGCENTEQKRMTTQSATVHLYAPSKYGIPLRSGMPIINEAVITDNESNITLAYGKNYNVTVDNGVVYVNPIFNYMLMHSSGIDGDNNVSSKPYVSSFMERYGTSFPNKCAFMSLDNESMANSIEHSRMFKKMTSVKFSDTIDKLVADKHIDLSTMSEEDIHNLSHPDFSSMLKNYNGYRKFRFEEDSIYDNTLENGNDYFCQIVDVELDEDNPGQYIIYWGNRDESVALTEERVSIESVYDLYTALGGINSFGYKDGKLTRTDESITHCSNMLCELDYQTAEEDDYNHTDIYKSAMTHLFATREAVKFSQANINDSDAIYRSDDDYEPNTINTPFADSGKQGNFGHVSSYDDEVALMTQIIYTCTGFGDMSKAAQEIQNALGMKMNQLVDKYRKVLIGSKDIVNGKEVYSTSIEDIKKVIVTDIAKYLHENKQRDASAMQNAMINAFSKFGEKMGVSDISFIRDNDFHNLIIDFASMINKHVRIRMNGTQNVLLPSDNMIRIHNGDTRSNYGCDEEEIEENLSKILSNAIGSRRIVEMNDDEECYMLSNTGRILGYSKSLNTEERNRLLSMYSEGCTFHTSINHLGRVDVLFEDIVNLPGVSFNIEYNDGIVRTVKFDNIDEYNSLYLSNSNINNISVNPYATKITHYDTSDLFVGESYYVINTDGTANYITITDINSYYDIKANHKDGMRYIEDVQTGRDLRCDLYTFKSNGRSYSTWDLMSVYYACQFNSGKIDAYDVYEFIKQRNDMPEMVISFDQFSRMFSHLQSNVLNMYSDYLQTFLRRCVNNDFSAIKNGYTVDVVGFDGYGELIVDSADTSLGYNYHPSECIMNNQHKSYVTIDEETGDYDYQSPDCVPGLSSSMNGNGFFDAEILTENGRTAIVATNSTLESFLSQKGLTNSFNISFEAEFYLEQENIDGEDNRKFINKFKIRKADKAFKCGSMETYFYVDIYQDNSKQHRTYPIFITDDTANLDTSEIVNYSEDSVIDDSIKSKIINNKNKKIRECLATDRHLKYVFCSRTPAQSKQSGMMMKVIANHNQDYNNVYVSKLQLLFHGSDFDIDKISQLIFTTTNGTLDMWSRFAKIDSDLNLHNSMLLPMPNELLSEIPVEKLVVSTSDPSAIDGSAYVDIQSLFEGYSDISSLDAKEFLEDCSGVRLRILAKCISTVISNNNTIPYDAKDIRAMELCNKFAEIFIEYNKPENYNDKGLNNFIMSRILDVFSDLDSYQEIANPLDSQVILKNIKQKYTEIRDSGLVSTGVIGSETCKTVDTQAGKDSVGIGANGNKALYASMASSLIAARSKDPNEIKNVMFEKTLHIPDEYGNFTDVTYDSIIGSTPMIVSMDDFKSTEGHDYLQQHISEHYNELAKVYENCKGRFKDRVDFMYAVMCYRSTLDSNQKKSFDQGISNAIKERFNGDNYMKMLGSSLQNVLSNPANSYWNAFDNITVVSEFISAAVDNAKEGILNILNAGTNMMNMYTYGLSIGVPIDALNRIMTSPIAIELNSLSSGDLYNGYEQVRVDRIISDIDKTPYPKTSIHEIIVEAIKDTLKKKDIGSVDINKDISKCISFKLNTFVGNVNKVLKKKSKASLNELVKRDVMEYLQRIEKYVKFKDIKNSSQEMFDNIIKLSHGASEMKLLTDLLKPAMGINVLPEDNDMYFYNFNKIFEDEKSNTIKNQIAVLNKELMERHPDYFNGESIEGNSIRLEFIAIDKQYLDGLVNIYNNVKDTFNIFYILKTNKNYLSAVESQCAHHLALYKLSKRFPATQYCKKVVLDKNGYAIKSKTLNKQVGDILETAYVNEFLKTTPAIVIPKGTELIRGIKSNGDTHTLLNDMPITLGTNYGNSFFKDYIEKEFFAKMLKNHTFINGEGSEVSCDFWKYLEIGSQSIYIKDVEIDKYTLNIDFAKNDTNVKIECKKAFEKIANMTTSITDVKGKKLTVHEVMTLYNYVVNHGSNAIDSFTQLLTTIDSSTNVYNKAFLATIESVVDNFDYKSKDFKEMLLRMTAPVMQNRGAADAFDKFSFWIYDSTTGDFQYHVSNKKESVSEFDDEFDYDEAENYDFEAMYEGDIDDESYEGDDYEGEDYDDEESSYEQKEYEKADYTKHKHTLSEFSPYGYHSPYITGTNQGMQFYDYKTHTCFEYDKTHNLKSIKLSDGRIFNVTSGTIRVGDKTIKLDDKKNVQYFPDGKIVPNFAELSSYVTNLIKQEDEPLICKL